MKRTLVLAASWALVLASPPADAEASSDDQPGARIWHFDVFLDDRRIGDHRFEVRGADAAREVISEARFAVQWLSLTVYRYDHETRETWRDGCLHEIEAKTRDNGEAFQVEGGIDHEGFVIQRNTRSSRLDVACVRSFAYWDLDALDAERLLNAQTGAFDPVTLRPLGQDTVLLDGEPIPSDKLVLSTSEGDIHLWYETDTGRWLALETEARGGRTLRYQPQRLPVPETDLTALSWPAPKPVDRALSQP